ncbi:MAG: WD40 repeat domain-containing protein [Acidobacteriota bacterium]|nr:WD40 repeat domain-containing protein [Acidobacteriota bacterium]
MNGHSGAVNNAAFSPDGKRVVTASADGTARIWDATTGKQVGEELRERSETGDSSTSKPVNSAAFSPDGRLIVTASDDYKARVWDASSGERLVTLSGHKKPVRSAAFNSEGTLIVTSSEDGRARIWDARSGKSKITLVVHRALHIKRKAGLFPFSFDLDDATVEPLYSAAFGPDPNHKFKDEFIVTADSDGYVRVWDVKSKTEVLVINGHNDAVKSAMFSPDASYIITASEDQTARVWNPCRDEKKVNDEILGSDSGKNRFKKYCQEYGAESTQK